MASYMDAVAKMIRSKQFPTAFAPWAKTAKYTKYFENIKKKKKTTEGGYIWRGPNLSCSSLRLSHSTL